MSPYGDSRSVTTRTESAGELLDEGRAHQLAGRLREGGECFALAIDAATSSGQTPLVAEALRRLGIVHHMQGETSAGMHYCRRSREVAVSVGATMLNAEATMALANMACEQGAMDEAREHYREALSLANGSVDLLARIEQNLGVVESIQGNLPEALGHFERALEASELARNILGRARAHHNIGMIRADMKEWVPAHRAFEQAATLAKQGGDFHLRGLCLLNRAEIDLAHQRYDEVWRQAEAALDIFDRLGARVDMADAYRMMGMAFRFLKRPTLAESRLRSALEIATSVGVPLTEAESCRDIGLLLAENGRGSEAIGFLDRSLKLFKQLGAAIDVAEVSKQRVALLAA